MILEVGLVLAASTFGYLAATYVKTKQIWDMQEHHEAQLEKQSTNLNISYSANKALRADLEKYLKAVDGYQREISGLIEELNDANMQLQHYRTLATKSTPVTSTKKRSTRPGKAARAAAKRRRESTHDLVVTGHSVDTVSAQGVSHVPVESYIRVLDPVAEAPAVPVVTE